MTPGPRFASSRVMDNHSQQAKHLSTDRVRKHTAPEVNERIDQLTHASVEAAARGGREAMQRRIAELDHEWDVDRALMVNFALAGGASFATGLARYADSPTFGPRRKGLSDLLQRAARVLAAPWAGGLVPSGIVVPSLGLPHAA